MTTAAGDLGPLFAAHRELRAVIEAVVERRQGTATVDGAAGRLSLGGYEIFGGDPATPGARRLVAGAARPRELRRLPCWSASHPVSQRLAERLGCLPATVCEVLFLL